MKRDDFKKIIKLRSFWVIEKGKNYHLASGKPISDYISDLVESQMKVDNLGILENGNLCFCTGGIWNEGKSWFMDYELYPPFKDTEICSYDEMQERIESLVKEILGI